jgi:hypothetical protein
MMKSKEENMMALVPMMAGESTIGFVFGKLCIRELLICVKHRVGYPVIQNNKFIITKSRTQHLN